jgi:ferredoxin/flavodoxin
LDIALICFSQTGNTRKVTEAMAGTFEDDGNTVRVIPLEKATEKDISKCDVFGTGTPCFGSQAPTPVKRFLKSLPRLDGHPAFVFATSGGGPGRVLYDQTRILRQKGANVLGGFLSRGEVFHPVPSGIGRFPNRPDERDLSLAKGFASALVEHINSGRTDPLSESRKDALNRRWGLYDILGVAVYDSILRLTFPAPKADSTACDQCMLCVKECPTGNISMHPYPVLGKQCIRCLRCITSCPKGAFNADLRLGNAVFTLFYSVAFERWFGDLERGEPAY